jgi:uncharacterized membrane protein YphA (DoxX/SURF4 family)
MQSSPLNFRHVVMLLGRVLLGAIFIYAGYSKAFLPNHTFWPFFFLKFSISTNLTNFALQVEAFKLLPAWGVQFVAHTLPFTEIALGLLVLLTAIMVGFFVVVLRAYLLHMDINCGCFATPEPINLKKVLEDAGLSALALLMSIFAFLEARHPHPWAAAPKPEAV